MKIKNIGVKPISICGVTLLPDKSCQVDDSYSDAVQLYAKLGFVAQEKQEKKSRKSTTKPPDSEAAAETAEEI